MLILQEILFTIMSVLKNLFLITVSPKLGWDDINKSGHTIRTVLSGGFYPMLLVLALASFAPMFYDHVEWNVSRCIIHSIAEIASYFASFYIVDFVLGGMFKELSKSNSTTIRTENFIAYNLMYLMFIEVLNNLMGYLFTPLLFLFLYVAVIAKNGADYLGITDEKRLTKFWPVASALMIAVPYVIKTLFELIVNF